MENLWFGLEDKVFVVTGGSRGIGLETAGSFGTEGKGVICARKQEGLERAQNELRGGDSLLAARRTWQSRRK